MSRFESAFQRLKLDSFFMPGHIREQCEVGAMLTVGVARADPAFPLSSLRSFLSPQSISTALCFARHALNRNIAYSFSFAFSIDMSMHSQPSRSMTFSSS